MYIANHYVRINRIMYIKGESIPDDLPEEKIEWLLKAGAIYKISDEADTDGEKTDPVLPEINQDIQQESEPVESEDDSEEERDEEQEVPEIDVMAGIIQDKPDEKKPKTSGRKTSERRKTK